MKRLIALALAATLLTATPAIAEEPWLEIDMKIVCDNLDADTGEHEPITTRWSGSYTRDDYDATREVYYIIEYPVGTIYDVVETSSLTSPTFHDTWGSSSHPVPRGVIKATLTVDGVVYATDTADCSESTVTVDAGKVIDDYDDCSLVTFEVNGDYRSYSLSHEGQLWATEEKQINEFRLLGTLFGVPGEEVSVATSDKLGSLGSGTYTLEVTDAFGFVVSRSVECGDLEYDIALNTQWEELETVHPVIDDRDIVKPKPETPAPSVDNLKVHLAHQPYAI